MKLKKWDKIIIVLLSLTSLLSAVMVMTNSNSKYDRKYVEIQVNGLAYKKVLLKPNYKDTIVINNKGKNVIEINDGKVRIADADCPDKICVKDGTISKPGEVLVCLPHKVVITIKGENKSETDELSY